MTSSPSSPSETQVPNIRVGSQFNSPVDDGSSRSSKSPSSIEDLNKEIERLFLNNEQFGFTSFIWDKEVITFFFNTNLGTSLIIKKKKNHSPLYFT